MRSALFEEDIRKRMISDLDILSEDVSDDGDGVMELTQEGEDVLELIITILHENGVDVII